MDSQITQDVSPLPKARPWKKAIPEARDRLQSKILVWIMVPFLCYLVFDTRFLHFQEHRLIVSLRMVIAVSAFFALVVWRLRAATPLAALSGGLICFLISVYSGNVEGWYSYGGGSIFHSGLTPLILLFVMTFSATRFRRDSKDSGGSEEGRKGRNAAQIIANLGVAALFSSLAGREWFYLLTGFSGQISGPFSNYLPLFAMFRIPMLAALAEATADTVSSEIGQAFPGKTFLVTTLSQVPPGTDGAISLIGTFAGICAAGLIAAVGAPALDLTLAECGLVAVAAILGLLFDSFLGATIERKGWLGNDLVNFASTGFSAVAAAVGIRLL